MSALPVAPANRIDWAMPPDEYRALPALGSSDVKRLLRSPAHYRSGLDEPSESTDAQDVGTAIHLGVFEPSRFDVEVVAAPKFDRRTTAGKAAAAEFEAAHAGRLVLAPSDYDAVRRAIDAVHAHRGARAVLDAGSPEVSMMWTDERTGAPCKARFDWLREDGGAVDLKSTRDASPAGFARAIAQFGYAVQAAHYDSGSQHVMGRSLPYWLFIAVEKEPPYAVGVYSLEREAIERCALRVADALSLWADCTRTGVWPAYGDLIQPITLPAWAN